MIFLKRTFVSWDRILMFALILAQPEIRAQSFISFLEDLSHMPAPRTETAIDSLLGRIPNTPLFENDTTVAFLYRGAGNTVSLAGDMNAWDPHADTLSRAAGTTLWYVIRSYEADARLDYKFVIDGTTWILDPRNPRVTRGGFGENSEVRMPSYPRHPELAWRNDIPHGTLCDTMLYSSSLKSSRRFAAYTSPGAVGTSDSLALIVVHDGQDFIDIAGMPGILDNMYTSGKLPCVLAVFIPPVDRSAEYDGERMAEFTSFIINDVLPFLFEKYPISRDPALHILMGASSGGNISLSVGATHPELFGAIAAFSSNVIPSVTARFATLPPLPVRVYLDLGTYDIPQLYPRVQGLRTVLRTYGYTYLYKEYHDGHSWANWRTHIDDALQFLIPGDTDR